MPLTIGLVGVGRWGMNIKHTLESLGTDVVVIEKTHNARPKLDGVCIATPSSTHAEVALPYLQSGCPTFIEKPMTTTLADALRLRDAALESKTLVFVGHIYLYNPAFATLRSEIASIGEMVRMEAVGENDTPRPDGSVLWDWLPHHLSMARELIGRDPSRVRTEPQETNEIRDAAAVTFDFGGVEVCSRISWVAGKKTRLVRVVGTRGEMLFDDAAEKKLTCKVGSHVTRPTYDETPPLTNELQAFLACITNGVSDRAHLDDAVAIVRAIEAAEGSGGEWRAF